MQIADRDSDPAASVITPAATFGTGLMAEAPIGIGGMWRTSTALEELASTSDPDGSALDRLGWAELARRWIPTSLSSSGATYEPWASALRDELGTSHLSPRPKSA